MSGSGNNQVSFIFAVERFSRFVCSSTSEFLTIQLIFVINKQTRMWQLN